MNRKILHYLVILAVLGLCSIGLAQAQTGGSTLQTGLVTDKSSYKLGETVAVKLILYNPTAQQIVVHFSGGCWYSFVIRDMSGQVLHNETWPACDPNVTNVMTVEPQGGRWYPMYWNQLDTAGRHVAPAEYVLSWSFRNPDQPILSASAKITLTSQPLSEFDVVESYGLQAIQFVGPFVWLGIIPASLPVGRLMKGVKRSSRMTLALPTAASGIATGVISVGFYFNQIFCNAIQCSDTFSFFKGLETILFITPVIWAAIFVMEKKASVENSWIPYVVFQSWTVCSGLAAVLILLSMREIWVNTFYYDWTIEAVCYGLLASAIAAQLLFYRAFKNKLVATRFFRDKVARPRTFLELGKESASPGSGSLP